MNFFDLKRNLSVGFNKPQFEKKIFQDFKKDDSFRSMLYNMQHEQIFDLSQGADGVQLGYYKEQKNKKRLLRKKNKVFVGNQYDMIFTGKLERNLKVKITNTYIEFKSDNPHVRNIQNRPFWGTLRWFGLNNENRQDLKKYIIRYKIRQPILNKMTTGQW